MSQPRFLKTISAVIVILLGLTMMATSLMAQSTTSGAINGVVTDATGAVVPGAKIEVKNIGTNDVTAATSDEGGRYHAVNLQPGKYEVRVAASNFAAFKATCIVEVGRITDVDAKLNAAGGAETVEVRDEAPVINTEHQDFANNIDQAAIQNLPINGRRWSNYALLTPNANPDGTFGLISFRGISGLLNNNTIDGGDNNSNFWGEERGRTRLSYSTSQDAVKEFQVNTSNYSAEYGRSAGGAVNTVTKSGTNNLHGSAYWYFRDNALGATNPSTTLNGVPFKPDDRRQQFGGTIGGAIIKDRLFYFFNYDQQKRNFPGDAIPAAGSAGYQYTSGPFTAAAPATACPAPNAAFPNSYTMGNAIYCRFGQNLALAQAASTSGYNFFTSLLGLTARTGDQLIFFPKVDVKVLGGNWATSYNWLNWTSPSGIQTQPTNTIAKDQFGSDLVRTRSVNSVYNRAFGGNTAFEGKFHWSTELLAGDFGTDLPGQASVAGPTGSHVPGASITGFLSIGTQSYLPRPALPEEAQYQESASLLFTRGKHNIKIGGEILHQGEEVQSLNQAYGTFSYTGNFAFANFLADTYNAANNNFTGSGVRACGTVALPAPCYGNLFQSLGTLGYHFGTNDYSGFIQDDYKIAPRLNLNFGLRYEYEAFPAPQFVNPAAAVTNNSVNDTNNFGPRAGFAYDVLGTGRLVVRGGYGLYYGRIINSTIAGALTSTGVATAQPNYTISASNTSPVYPNLATAGSNTPGIVYFAPGLQNPMIHEFDGIVEYEVVKNTVVSASYMKSMGRGLLNFLDTNLGATSATNTFTRPDGSTFTIPTYGTAARPNASFNQITKISNSVDSDYDAVVFQVTRRMTSNWQLQSSYTYSRSTDNGQNSTTFTTGNNALDPNNPQNEFGRSAFDVPQKFIFTAVWQPSYFKDRQNAMHYLLDGWTLAPIVNLSSGFTYTGVVSGNLPFGNCNGSHNSGINCSAPGFGDNRPPDVEKNSFRTSGRYTTDFRLSRTFDVTEKTHVEFISEAFNLFNHPNVSGINNTEYSVGACSGSTATNNLNCPLLPVSSFGTPSSVDGGTNLRERQIQFAVRFTF